MLEAGPKPLLPATLSSSRFIVTGTGSSEAHARYLSMLINFHTERSASYLPLTGFTVGNREAFRGQTLVVFSQGVSPNAQIALNRYSDFAHTILFSATTPAAARAAGKQDRAERLERLQSAGAELIEFPLAEEYTTLIRFVGPMAGYLACLQFVAQLASCRFKVPAASEIIPLLSVRPPDTLVEAMNERPNEFAGGFDLVAAAPISEYAQNLACKFMEGVFWPCPPISDFLQFAHGPFQQMHVTPHAVVILAGASTLETELMDRSVAMLKNVGLPAYVVTSKGPPLLAIFEYETIFNKIVFDLMRRNVIDQVNWPGKGRDDLLYGFCPDSSAAC